MATRLQLRREKKLEAEKEKAKNSLFYLAGKLGYDLMSEGFHRPILEWLDANRDHTRIALFAPRKSYKSRIEIIEIVQALLRDPNEKVLLVHHNLKLARELVVECGELFVKNKWLRSLLDEKNTPPAGKQGEARIMRSDGGEFCLPGVDSSAEPSLRGASYKQGLTGAHPTMMFLDDVIHDETVEHMGGVAAVRDWVKRTVIPLIGQTDPLRVKGTFWSHDDWYHDLMKDRKRGDDGKPGTGENRWLFQKRGILENEKQDPDWNGDPIPIYVRKGKSGPKRLLNMQDVHDFMDEMGIHFSGQMMNDPRREGSLPWKSDSYKPCTFAEIMPYIRSVIMTMDPAPLGMKLDGTTLKKKKGKKDDWAIAVIALCQFPGKTGTVRVLLDGDFSDNWGTPEAMQIAVNLIKQWRVELVAVEEGSASMENELYYSRCLKEEIDKFVEVRNFVEIVKCKGRQAGKSARILELCSNANRGRLMINTDQDMNKEFVEEFLNQVSSWAGKNTIEKDDVLDAVAYCDDPAIHEEVSLGPAPLRDDPYTRNTAYVPKPQPRRFRHL